MKETTELINKFQKFSEKEIDSAVKELGNIKTVRQQSCDRIKAMRTPEQRRGDVEPKLIEKEEQLVAKLEKVAEAARLGGGNSAPENSDDKKQDSNIDDIAQATRNFGA